MSACGMSAALRTPGLTLIQRAVFCYLCDREKEGRCWPSFDEIAWELGVSRRAVIAAIKALEDKDHITVERNKHQTSTYRLPRSIPNPPRYRDQRGATDAPQWHYEEGATDAPLTGDGVQTVHPRGANDGKTGVQEVHPESPKKESPKDSPKEGQRAHAREAVADADVQAVVNAWNEMAAQTGIPKARTVAGARRSKLAKRIKEHGVAGVLEAIEKIGASRFCTGNNPRGWKADFGFLLQEESLSAAREGRYDNRTPKLDPANLTGFEAVFARARARAQNPPMPDLRVVEGGAR